MPHPRTKKTTEKRKTKDEEEGDNEDDRKNRKTRIVQTLLPFFSSSRSVSKFLVVGGTATKGARTGVDGCSPVDNSR